MTTLSKILCSCFPSCLLPILSKSIKNIKVNFYILILQKAEKCSGTCEKQPFTNYIVWFYIEKRPTATLNILNAHCTMRPLAELRLTWWTTFKELEKFQLDH